MLAGQAKPDLQTANSPKNLCVDTYMKIRTRFGSQSASLILLRLLIAVQWLASSFINRLNHTLSSRYIPAWKIFANQVNKQEVANKIIFIGVNAKGLLDMRFNPFGNLIAGVVGSAWLAFVQA